MSNVIRVSLLGDSKDLTRELDKAEDGFKDLKKQADNTSDGFTNMGDKADVAEQRTMGLRDMIDGTAAVMAGPGEQGISSYLQGWADMASGVTNFAMPALKTLKTQIIDGGITSIKTAASTAAAAVKSVGRQVAAWVLLGVQSMIHAAKVAAAWLISMGPIVLVIAAVVGLVYLIIKNFDKIKEVIAAAWEWVKDKTSGFVGWLSGLGGKISSSVSGMFDGIKDNFKNAVNFLIEKWNSFELKIGGFTWKLPSMKIPNPFGKDITVGGQSIDIPGWKLETPNIPKFHSGGTFHSSQGEGLALLKDGERVLSPGQSQNDGGSTYNISVSTIDPQAAGKAVVDALKAYQRSNGAIPISVRSL